MTTRAIRVVGGLFGLSLMLTACDSDAVMQLFGDRPVEQDMTAAAEALAQADKGADARGRTEAREFQGIRDGQPRQRAPKAASAGDTAPKKKARAGGGAAADTNDGAAAGDGRTSAPADKGGDGDAGATAPVKSPKAPAKTPTAPPKDEPSTDTGGASGGAVSAIEQQISDKLNATRRQAGLKALTLSPEVSAGAREWACTMAQSSNFRHADLRAAGVNGENIAWGQRSAAEVHDGWMNSAGHRDNRMNARWTEYGVGVCKDSSGRLYYTERFR